jgi:foldase protein PrsA
MSEGIHSASETASVSTPITTHRPGRKWGTILGGTAAVVIGAGVLFQVLRPEPAVSQTAEKPVRGAVTAKGRAALDTSSSSETLARVNNQTIGFDMVAKECVDRHGKEVLDNMINRLLIQQECDRNRIEISEAEVEQEITQITEKFKLPLDQWYKMLAAERGVTPEQYKNDVIWPMLALRKLAGLQAESQVTEADMLHAFERDYGPRVKARMILLNGNGRQAAKIWDQCKADPDKFEDLAAEYSADPNTRSLGGAMPPIRKHGGLPQLEEAAFKLKEGEISPIVQVGEQHFILKCEGRTEPITSDPKSVWDELYAQVTEEKTQLAVANTFKEIKDRAEIHNYLDGTSSTPVGNASIVKPASKTAPAQRPAAGATTKPVSATRTTKPKSAAVAVEAEQP